MEEIQLRRFLHNLQHGDKTLFRKYEKTYLSVISTAKAIRFNENCIREQLCPKSLYRGGLTWQKRQKVEDLLRQRNVDYLRRLDDLEAQKLRLLNAIMEELQLRRFLSNLYNQGLKHCTVSTRKRT